MEEQTKQEEFRPSWAYFIFFGVFSMVSFYEKVYGYFGGIFFGIFAILCFPNHNIHVWIMKQVSNIKKLIVSLLYLGLVLLVIGVFIWFLGKIFNGIGSLGKYEGQTAKEWYYDYVDAEDRYEEFRSCVTDYDSLSVQTQLKYGGVYYYCE